MTDKKYPNRHPIRRNRERGVALIVALMAMTVLTAIGFALMLSSSTETLIHSNFRSSGIALYASRGGLEEARGRMGPDAVTAAQINPPANLTSAIYIRRNNTITPTQPGCTFNTVDCFDPDAALTPTVTFVPSAQDGSVPSVWTKITLATQRKLNRNLVEPDEVSNLDDTILVCWNGQNLMLAPASNPTCDTTVNSALTPAYIFTALSIDPGGARRTIRQVGAYGTLPGLPSPLTLDGPNPTFQGGNSNQYQIDGIDSGTQGDSEPAIGVIQQGDVGPLNASIPKQKQDDYPGTGGGSPTTQNVSSSLDPLYQTCAGLDSLLTTLQAAADHVYTGATSSLPDPGTVADPVINFVDGNLTLSGSFTGAGILVVTGNLVFSGDPTYNGIIYVIGTGSFLQSGGGDGQFNGGIFLANTTTCPTGLGSPSYVVSGGGNNGIQYNTDLTEPPSGYMPIQLVSLNY